MRIDYIIEGTLSIPAGTQPLEGVANQFLLPSGEIISIHPVIEMASATLADDHRDLTYSEALGYGLELTLYDRSAELVSDD